MLFAADALIVQLAPEVKPPQQGVMAFSWALRLVMGAAQAYYNMVCRYLLQIAPCESANEPAWAERAVNMHSSTHAIYQRRHQLMPHHIHD